MPCSHQDRERLHVRLSPRVLTSRSSPSQRPSQLREHPSALVREASIGLHLVLGIHIRVPRSLSCHFKTVRDEFRGGRGLRGPNRTKWWIAFVISFVQLCISSKQFPSKNPKDRPDTDYFWRKIQKYARTIYVADSLPPDWRDLNESSSNDLWEDANGSDSEDSETSSIISKSASEYSDSDYSSGDEEQMHEDLEQERRDQCVVQ